MSKTFDSDANGPGSKHKVFAAAGQLESEKIWSLMLTAVYGRISGPVKIVLGERMAALFVPTGAVGLDDSAVVRDFGQGEKATRQMQPGCRRG